MTYIFLNQIRICALIRVRIYAQQEGCDLILNRYREIITKNISFHIYKIIEIRYRKKASNRHKVSLAFRERY